MVKYNIRKIESQEDIEKFKDLWCERSKRMKTPVEDQLVEFEKGITIGTPVGAFDSDNRLVGVLKYRRSLQIPCMFLYNIHIKKNLLTRYDFTDGKNPITPILDFILHEAEADGYYTWYYVRALSSGYHKLHKTGKDLFTQSSMCYDKDLGEYRYERYVEEIIPSGKESKYPGFRVWLGDKPWVPNLALFKCVLKNKFRKNGNVLDDESNYF
jgi:hypothetical protein